MSGRFAKILLLVAVIFLASVWPAINWWQKQTSDVLGSEAAKQLQPLPVFTISPKPWKLQQASDKVDGAGVESTSLILINETDGQILAERQAYTKRPMASLTKIMTAAIVLELTKPDSVIVIPKDATRDLPLDSAMMGITPGEQYTVKELLYGMLLPSGNDAAQALAIAVAGSQPRFVALMNAKAQQLGLKQTHFTNASGLDGPGHYSTAYDLAIMAHYAQSFPLFKAVVATKHYQIPYTLQHKYLDLYNANAFIETYEGATGIKPGNTGLAGNCLVASAERNGHQLLGVLLDTPGRNTNMARLFDAGFTALSNSR